MKTHQLKDPRGMEAQQTSRFTIVIGFRLLVIDDVNRQQSYLIIIIILL